jgi:hypothetical protein
MDLERTVEVEVEVEVTLRLTVSQSASLGVEPLDSLGLVIVGLPL